MRPFYYLVGWGYAACCVYLGLRRAPEANVVSTTVPSVGSASAGEEWFRRIKPYCNSVEVSVAVRQNPAPSGIEGTGFVAACFALAGHIDDARRVIDALPADDRYKAAGIVFNIGHPIADAGDDRAAGPIMELVIDYWPNHYMALYHAGMAEYMVGQNQLATKSLTDFLRVYQENDGWRSNAMVVLKRLQSGKVVERTDLERPREP